MPERISHSSLIRQPWTCLLRRETAETAPLCARLQLCLPVYCICPSIRRTQRAMCRKINEKENTRRRQTERERGETGEIKTQTELRLKVRSN